MNIILHIVTNDFSSDNRVLRSALASQRMGTQAIVYALHRRRHGLPDRERKEGVPVYRFRLKSLNWPRYLPFQIIKYFEAVVRMSAHSRKLKPAVVHANDLSGMIVGFLITKLNNAKLVYDSHELLSETRGTLAYPKVVAKLLLCIERLLAVRADAVITVSAGIADKMAVKLGISTPAVIRNLPNKKNVKLNCNGHPLRHALKLGREKSVILYQGGIGPGRGAQVLLESMLEVKHPDTVLVFLGNGSMVKGLKKRARDLNLEKIVYFHPAVESSVLPHWTADATIGVHPMEGICLNHLLALPNKIFEYIQAGLPVIVSNLPEMSKIVHEYGVGEDFADRNASELAAKINGMLADTVMMERYKQAAIIASQKLNWEREQEKLIRVYRRLF